MRCASFVLVAVFAMPAAAQDSWGTIRGQILWGGKDIPKADVFNIGKNPDKDFCLSKGAVDNETWVVDPKTKGLRDVFVWLAPKDAKDKTARLPIHPKLKAVPADAASMDQPVCSFIPHALALRHGQSLLALNSSGIGHNFRYVGSPNVPANSGNLLIPAGKQVEIKNLAADRLPIRVSCSVHPWMDAWIRVFDHPYFAVTDAQGSFQIKDAPVGEFRLLIWHGSGGWLGGAEGRTGRAIEVKATTDLGKIEYPPPF
ncbi:MAG: hypothetical protein U0744_02980 [Gemmataceae bacterium]